MLIKVITISRDRVIVINKQKKGIKPHRNRVVVSSTHTRNSTYSCYLSILQYPTY